MASLQVVELSRFRFPAKNRKYRAPFQNPITENCDGRRVLDVGFYDVCGRRPKRRVGRIKNSGVGLYRTELNQEPWTGGLRQACSKRLAE